MRPGGLDFNINPSPRATKRPAYLFELSMRKVEMSRTLVFDDSNQTGVFFEALVAENIGVGRPEEIRAVFVP